MAEDEAEVTGDRAAAAVVFNSVTAPCERAVWVAGSGAGAFIVLACVFTSPLHDDDGGCLEVSTAMEAWALEDDEVRFAFFFPLYNHSTSMLEISGCCMTSMVLISMDS